MKNKKTTIKVTRNPENFEEKIKRSLHFFKPIANNRQSEATQNQQLKG